jgi:hypothetical protein
VNLDKIDHEELGELITDSWLIKAASRLRREFKLSSAPFGPKRSSRRQSTQCQPP